MGQSELTDSLNEFADKLANKILENFTSNSLQDTDIVKNIIAINCCKQITKNPKESDVEYIKRFYNIYKTGRNLIV